MKIAHVAPPWLPVPPKTYGGTEQVLYDLIEAQVASGHDVTLFAPANTTTSATLLSFIPRPLREEGVPWHSYLKAYYYLCRSIEAAQNRDIDLLHTHLSTSTDLYLFPLTASLAIPHVTTLHSRFPFDSFQEWTGDADTFYLNQWASTVPLVTISEQARKECPPELQVAGVVHNGLSLQYYVGDNQPREDYLVWLGKFIPQKGPHLAIEAARGAQRPLILAGTVDSGVPESVNYFREMILPQIDQQHVYYVGPVGKQQKIRLMSRAYGFLNPIQWEEPFGMVMIEAMALGCPVISFARGAAPELIVDGKTGFLVHNVDQMIQAVPLIDELNRNATRRHIESHFSACIMAERYVEVYQKVILSFDDLRQNG